MSDTVKDNKNKPYNNYEIIERVCANTNDGSHMLIIQARCRDTGETVWVIGDDHVCAVTREDCVRNRDIPYNSVLIQEFPYKEYTPESVGEWRPLIEELVECMIGEYIEHDGLVHLYPWWVPEGAYAHLGKEVFEQASKRCDHIIFRESHMEFVLKG